MSEKKTLTAEDKYLMNKLIIDKGKFKNFKKG